jgi:high frequency lysogenization protein
MVAGEQRHLSDPENADRIRAVLLAGIRSAVLWRQCGGVRWKLLFHRGRLQQEARRLLKSL